MTTLDETKMHTFGEKLINDGSAMMLGNLAYIGDKLGLFKQLAYSGPVTVEAFARQTACHPRYIREWLSAMAAAGWIAYDAPTEQFSLPPEHAPFLALEDHPMFMGGMFATVVPLAQVAPAVMNCFRHGGGVAFADHHPEMAEAVDRLTMPHFKNFLTQIWLPALLPDIHQKLTSGALVADIGCGTGRALVELAKAYPNSHFTGYEPNPHSAELARERVNQAGVAAQVEIIAAPAEAITDQQFDFITTFDVVHDSVAPQALIDTIYRALKPDGVYLILEIHASHRLEEMLHPLGRFFYSISTMYCMTVSLAHDGAGIGTCMGEELPRQMCAEAGFSQFRKLDFEHPLVVLYEVRR